MNLLVLVKWLINSRIKILFKYITPKSIKILFYQHIGKNDIECESKLLDALALFNIGNKGEFLDIGANLGAWSKYALSKFDQVHAFEPDKQLCKFIKRRFGGKISMYNVALSDTKGTSKFYVPIMDGNEIKSRGSLKENANAGFVQTTRDVIVDKLDNYKFSYVTCIKIDVEGNEFSVLRGGENLLNRFKPLLIIEIEERHHKGESIKIFNYLSGLGYVAFVLDNHVLEDINNVEFEKITIDRRFNNFIFMHKNSQEMISEVKKSFPHY